MLREKARLVARVVYLTDLGLTSLAFFTAFFIRDVILPHVAPHRFPTGLFPIHLVIWSVLLFSYHSYHSHRTVMLTKEVTTTLRVVLVGNVLLATLAFLLPLRQLSRTWFILFVTLSALFLVMEKIAIRIGARYVRAKGL